MGIQTLVLGVACLVVSILAIRSNELRAKWFGIGAMFPSMMLTTFSLAPFIVEWLKKLG